MKDRWRMWKSSVWAARVLGSYPNVLIEVGPANTIEIFFSYEKGKTMEGFRISRRLAKLLATRINQCLDQTK